MAVARLLHGRTAAVTAVGLLAALVYVNTLLADFTFDDNFAVITNADVHDPAIPIRELFKHDFWGQDITSSQSHKSYRPLTILVFRLTHRAWCLLTAVAPGIQQLLLKLPPTLPSASDDTRPERPLGLHPFPFHVLCVVMHAVASMLVLGLCQHMFAVLEDSCAPGASCRDAASTASTGGSVAQPAGLPRRLLMWQRQGPLWRLPSSSKYRAMALFAGLMFALHPIHTEAVAGVVGCAELICVALSCPALLCYFMAVDGRYAAAQQLSSRQAAAAGISTRQGNSKQASKQPGRTVKSGSRPRAVAAPAGDDDEAAAALLPVADAVQHWLLVLAAASLALCAALSKEIGITVVGTMLLYDLLLGPNMRAAGSASWAQRLQPAGCRRQVLRMVVAAATAVAYVKLRQWVAVQQLVNIYRKVENPIPFAESRLTRAMSTGYLHARYAWLLFMPLHLSADWSFSCIPLVEHCSDVRNLATLVLYCYFIYTALAARPVSLLRHCWRVARLAAGLAPPTPQAARKQGTAGAAAASNGTAAAAAEGAAGASALPGAGCAVTRWCLMVLVGLVVAPFFPASNVLFYVGTFIGERLLYSPSIGFCLLAAQLAGAALPDDWRPQQQQQQHTAGGPAQALHAQSADAGRTSDQQAVDAAAAAQPCASHLQDDAGPAATTTTSSSSSLPARSWCMVLLCALLLAGYAGRTLLRNQDWWDEERLFLAALRVCPDSAKVQQNNGVLQRRFQNYEAAMQHFRRAQEIEPGYCEPSYWIGMTTFNMGDPQRGLSIMKASLSCKYTAGEALQALNKVYMLLMEAGKGADPGPLLEWASVLASPHVLRLADACSSAEDAALGAALAGKGAAYVSKAVGVCLKGIQLWDEGPIQADTLAALAKQRLSDTNTTLLAACVNERLAVYKKMASHPLGSKPARRAVYKYVAQVMEHYPACRTMAGGGPMPLEGDTLPEGQPSTHQRLMHKAQGADPDDPWLQYEWGATLLALGPATHLRDAGMHLDVAAAILAKAAQDLLAAQQQQKQQQGGRAGSDGDNRLLHLTELDGQTPLTPLTAQQAAVRPLTAFKDAAVGSTDAALQAQVCEVMQRLCHLRLQTVMVLQQQGGAPDATGSAQAAMEAARQCLAEISGRPGCEAQAAKLRKMVRVK